MDLEIGTKAPAFVGKDQNGKTIQLSDFVGKKLVLYFYPKDDTPGCTKEACNLRDNYDMLLKQGYAVVGISADDAKAHLKFIEKHSLPFPLIADTDKTIHGQFGTWIEKSMYGRKYMGTARTTYVIDDRGIIQDIISKVKTDNHVEQILK